jgi:hypothetical protein
VAGRYPEVPGQAARQSRPGLPGKVAADRDRPLIGFHRDPVESFGPAHGAAWRQGVVEGAGGEQDTLHSGQWVPSSRGPDEATPAWVSIPRPWSMTNVSVRSRAKEVTAQARALRGRQHGFAVLPAETFLKEEEPQRDDPEKEQRPAPAPLPVDHRAADLDSLHGPPIPKPIVPRSYDVNDSCQRPDYRPLSGASRSLPPFPTSCPQEPGSRPAPDARPGARRGLGPALTSLSVFFLIAQLSLKQGKPKRPSLQESCAGSEFEDEKSGLP